jgi:AraC family transcriptional regulator of adaptative response/methylated-DNA-[protein]-cysteine methyltransferase
MPPPSAAGGRASGSPPAPPSPPPRPGSAPRAGSTPRRRDSSAWPRRPAGGRGEAIRFAVGASSLGSVLVAATDVGVCAVFLGDDPAALVVELRRRFLRADVHPADAAFDAWVAKVVALVEAPAAAFDLPLDLRGTAFQVRVWEALRRIPAGTTTTYAKLAEQLGQPTAARAVARACATNHVSVAVPCHRVVGATGALTGYRWGVERKAELLKREGRHGAGRGTPQNSTEELL